MLKQNLAGALVAAFALCENRHSAPVEEAIFPHTIPLMQFGKLELLAHDKLDPLVQKGLVRLVVYTSGCMQAAIALLNVCNELHIREVVFMHYDSVSNGYHKQNVTTYASLCW